MMMASTLESAMTFSIPYTSFLTALLLTGSTLAADPLPQPLQVSALDGAGGSVIYTGGTTAAGAEACRFDITAGGGLSAGTGRFVHQVVPGDADLTVRVTATTGAAGLALRTSAQTIVVVAEPGRLVRMLRLQDGAVTTLASGSSAAAEVGLRLVRRGSTVAAEQRDGSGWIRLAEATVAGGALDGGLWVSAGTARFADWNCRLIEAPAHLGGNWGERDCYADLMRGRSRP
jgi:hypothetical protein